MHISRVPLLLLLAGTALFVPASGNAQSGAEAEAPPPAPNDAAPAGDEALQSEPRAAAEASPTASSEETIDASPSADGTLHPSNEEPRADTVREEPAANAATGPKEPSGTGPVITLPDSGRAQSESGATTAATPEANRLSLGGYGEAQLTHSEKETEANLRRFVLYVGYQFASWAHLRSELEVEDAHEVEMEQALIDLTPLPPLGVRLGLMLVPVGIINQVHEPTTFNGVDRPLVDQVIIPSTWRELGAGLFGDLPASLHYQLYVMNGLDASRFSATSGIRDGRGGGEEAQARNPALTGRLSYTGVLGLDVGASFYYGGAGQDTPALGGVRVGLLEGDVRFSRWGLELRGEYVRVFIHGAARITRFLRDQDPTAEAMGKAEQGYYAEVGYNVLSALLPKSDHKLVPFARFESIDTRAARAKVEAAGASLLHTFLVAGLTYKPLPQLVFKADYRAALEEDAQASLGEEDESAEEQLSFGVGYLF